MKKMLMACMLCLISMVSFAQTMLESTEAFSISNQDPILESTESNATLTITPQIVKHYDCNGNVVDSYIQYNISLYSKFMGMTSIICDQTVSGKTLCLLKTLAQKTQESMNNNGNEGLVIDNGLFGTERFRIEVSEIKPFMMKRGWYMSIYHGHASANSTGYILLNRKVTAEFIDVLANLKTE